MNDRRIRILYEREGCTSERTLDPLGLIAKGMTWYVAGGIDDDVRTYRVSRIREVELLDSFIRPPDFDLAAFWERSQESFRERLPRFQVVARIRPDAMPLFRTMIRFGAIDDVNGDVVTMHFDAEEVARINLRGFGDAVEIIEGLTL
jgi:predicted DNA-binding transcriptional regulator YafY